MGLDRLQGQHRYAVESRQLANQRRRREDEEDRISYGFTVVRAGGDGVRLQTPGGGSLSADSTSNGAFIEGATIPTEVGKGQNAIGRSNCCPKPRRRRYYSDDPVGGTGPIIAIALWPRDGDNTTAGSHRTTPVGGLVPRAESPRGVPGRTDPPALHVSKIGNLAYDWIAGTSGSNYWLGADGTPRSFTTSQLPQSLAWKGYGFQQSLSEPVAPEEVQTTTVTTTPLSPTREQRETITTSILDESPMDFATIRLDQEWITEGTQRKFRRTTVREEIPVADPDDPYGNEPPPISQECVPRELPIPVETYEIWESIYQRGADGRGLSPWFFYGSNSKAYYDSFAASVGGESWTIQWEDPTIIGSDAQAGPSSWRPQNAFPVEFWASRRTGRMGQRGPYYEYVCSPVIPDPPEPGELGTTVTVINETDIELNGTMRLKANGFTKPWVWTETSYRRLVNNVIQEDTADRDFELWYTLVSDATGNNCILLQILGENAMTDEDAEIKIYWSPADNSLVELDFGIFSEILNEAILIGDEGKVSVIPKPVPDLYFGADGLPYLARVKRPEPPDPPPSSARVDLEIDIWTIPGGVKTTIIEKAYSLQIPPEESIAPLWYSYRPKDAQPTPVIS